MKWLYVIQHKAQVAFLLAIILLGIFIKNVIDRNNVAELGDSFSSVYKDRLLVESYIYKLSEHLYQKQLLIDQCGQRYEGSTMKSKIVQHNLAIRSLIQEYEKTKLTSQESVFFGAFKKNINDMVTLEDQYLKTEPGLGAVTTSLDQQFFTASKNLERLSIIQIEEGKSLADHSKKIIAGSSLLTQFELAMIVVIGLIIQALVFASSSITPKTIQKHQLN